MSRKTITTWAIIMAAVFLVIVIVYPMMFNSNKMTPVTTDSPVAPSEPALTPTGK